MEVVGGVLNKSMKQRYECLLYRIFKTKEIFEMFKYVNTA